MSREQERTRRKLEENPVVECNKVQKKFYPELFQKFSEVKDPRHQSYITYSSRTYARNDVFIINAWVE